ncbi:MAG TPA: hypothetical protein VFP68_05965 [Burkholderiaceae bacterium]|nr:hypothetical protein [Burkholderiaceae bacterium]
MRNIDRNGKTDGLRTRDDRGIDANRLAPRVEQRPVGIAGIERSVGLYHVRDEAARGGTHTSTQRAHDACRCRMLESERIADGDCNLAPAHFGRTTQRQRRERPA